MRILFLGDIVGRSGRDAVIANVPKLRERFKLDFVVANCENATQGHGITMAHARTLLSCGIDCMTLGDHAFDQRELISTIDSESRILRPENIAHSGPGKGFGVFHDNRQRKLLVIVAVGRVFMNQPFDDPFRAVDRVLSRYPLGGAVHSVMIDFHAEATSEKMAMGHYCDGRATLVAGTHTHVPTADSTVLKGGTAYISDVGMCGYYDSVIGMKKDEPISRFVTGIRRQRLEPAPGEASLCGVLVESDDGTGLARRIEPLRIGGLIPQAVAGS